MRVTSREGVVTAGSAEAVNAGLRVLASGGNAADAAAATLLASCVTQIGSVCLGGEGAAIVFDAATGRATVLAGQGGAPRNPRAIATMLRDGLPHGGIRAATTPANLDLSITLLREFGSKTFEEVAGPTVELLANGRPSWYVDSALSQRLDAFTGAAFAPDADAPPATRSWSDDLAATLGRLIAAERSVAGPRARALEQVAECYRTGEVARALACWYHEQHAYLAADDLAAHRTALEAPVTCGFRGWTVCKADTWTQGPWLLQALRMVEGFDLESAAALDRAHHLAEVIKLALADRDRHFGDPRHVDVPIAGLLSDDYVDIRRRLVDPASARAPVAGDPVRFRGRLARVRAALFGGRATIACIAGDRHGNLVVMTPSGVGSTAGSGGTTGLTHGTRLTAASTQRRHPNVLAPGKRPCVTPSPTLVLRDGVPVVGISVPGGHLQDQVALHVVLEVIERGSTIDDLIARDGEFTPVLIDARGGRSSLKVQKALWASLGPGLQRYGHAAEPTTLSFHRLGGSLVTRVPFTGAWDAFGLVAGGL